MGHGTICWKAEGVQRVNRFPRKVLIVLNLFPRKLIVGPQKDFPNAEAASDARPKAINPRVRRPDGFWLRIWPNMRQRVCMRKILRGAFNQFPREQIRNPLCYWQTALGFSLANRLENGNFTWRSLIQNKTVEMTKKWDSGPVHCSTLYQPLVFPQFWTKHYPICICNVRFSQPYEHIGAMMCYALFLCENA